MENKTLHERSNKKTSAPGVNQGRRKAVNCYGRMAGPAHTVFKRTTQTCIKVGTHVRAQTMAQGPEVCQRVRLISRQAPRLDSRLRRSKA